MLCMLMMLNHVVMVVLTYIVLQIVLIQGERTSALSSAKCNNFAISNFTNCVTRFSVNALCVFL